MKLQLNTLYRAQITIKIFYCSNCQHHSSTTLVLAAVQQYTATVCNAAVTTANSTIDLYMDSLFLQ